MEEADAAGTIRVLLADDDAPFLESLSPLIERQPALAVVGTALDGLAAIELADELSPDAVVIDLHMPRLDGVSAVARLRRDHPSMCVIALTGDEHPALHEAVTEAGADAVLMKAEFVDVLMERLAAAKAAGALTNAGIVAAVPIGRVIDTDREEKAAFWRRQRGIGFHFDACCLE